MTLVLADSAPARRAHKLPPAGGGHDEFSDDLEHLFPLVWLRGPLPEHDSNQSILDCDPSSASENRLIRHGFQGSRAARRRRNIRPASVLRRAAA